MTLLNLVWALSAILKYGGFAVAVTGVGIFGFFFIRENARSAHGRGNTIPPDAWRGAGPKFGIMVLASGLLLQLVAFLIAVLLPGRT
jgi:hypothetical protein